MKTGEEPLRKIVTRKMKLSKITDNLRITEQERNDQACRECSADYSKQVWDHETGDVVCVECGTVAAQTILDSCGSHGSYNSSRSNGDPVHSAFRQQSVCSTYPIYVRYFHFNEVLATLTLTGPWINNADFREIKRDLRRRGKKTPTRGDIQTVCKHLNKTFGVKRFNKKYCEKWIQIKFRYCGERPPVLHPNVIRDVQRDFRIISALWPNVQHLLQGSKKTTTRVQWPNYQETTYRLLKLRHPEVLPELAPWLTRPSKKKRKELKPFFNKVFTLAGFHQ